MNCIPAKKAEFIKWSGNLIDVSKARAEEWALPADKPAELEALHSEAKGLHEKCKTASYTQLDMQVKNERKDPLKKKDAEFVRFHLQNNGKVSDTGRKEAEFAHFHFQNNGKVSDTGWKELRIPIYDKTPTPRSAPDSVPEVEVETPQTQTPRIKFRHENAARWESGAVKKGPLKRYFQRRHPVRMTLIPQGGGRTEGKGGRHIEQQ